eukprot:g5999.t1
MDITKQTMSVESYTRYFVKKIVKDEKYRTNNDLQTAGNEFYTLLQRFAQEGDREDVRTPFKIMKDEFMNEWKTSTRDTRAELIRRLFGVLDVVHEECQQSVQYRINGTEVSERILEEFRLRLMKMVVGDTWKEALPLRLEALKRMHRYRNRELEGYSTNHLHKNTLKHRAKHLTVKKLKKTVIGHSTSSWTAVFNDLLLSSGSRLAPLLFSILDENQVMEEQLGNQQMKTSDGGLRTPSTKSVQSCSSGGSSSNRMVQVASAEGEKETIVPQYYKSLNSDLNAKLQLLKRHGRTDGGGGVSRIKDNMSEESGGGGGGLNTSIHNEEESLTSSRSEENVDGPNGAVTPFFDETPPPWSQFNGGLNSPAQFGLSNGELRYSNKEGLKLQQSNAELVHSSSAKVHKAEVQDRGIKKSASYQASGFSFTPQTNLSFHQQQQQSTLNDNIKELESFQVMNQSNGIKYSYPDNSH